VGPLLIDTRRAKVSVQEAPLELSSRQFEILLLLATRAGEFVHRQDFAATSRHPGEEGSRSVDMHVSRIRSKLRQMGRSGLCIYTVHGLGYCLSYKEEEDSTIEQATTLGV
jgi:DNA-binding response OmpR family regulator